jgi:hypothetical protein
MRDTCAAWLTVLSAGYALVFPLERSAVPVISSAYRPRKPKESQYYQCVEDHFEEFEQVYDEQFTVK